jgi:hypothetical protein
VGLTSPAKHLRKFVETDMLYGAVTVKVPEDMPMRKSLTAPVDQLGIYNIATGGFDDAVLLGWLNPSISQNKEEALTAYLEKFQSKGFGAEKYSWQPIPHRQEAMMTKFVQEKNPLGAGSRYSRFVLIDAGQNRFLAVECHVYANDKQDVIAYEKLDDEIVGSIKINQLSTQPAGE